MAIPCDLSDMDAVDALVADVEKRIGGVDILINNAARSIRRPLAESLERWHDVERIMVLNYYAPAAADPRARARHARARRRPHHQRLDLGRDVGGVADVRGVQRVEGRAVGGRAGSSKPSGADRGVHSTTLLLPAGGHSDDQTDEGV